MASSVVIGMHAFQNAQKQCLIFEAEYADPRESTQIN